jgi:uncharacterized membrane protein HdeD (DUF308 family)
MRNAERSSMLSSLAESWWALALRGVAAVLFGILAVLLPGVAVLALVFAFGAYALADGMLALVAGIRGSGRRWVLLVEGLVGIVAGLLALVLPGVTIEVLLYLIAAWAVIIGVLEIPAAIWLRREMEGEWTLVLGGILSVIVGVGLAVLPRLILLSMVWVVGVYALIFGVALIAAAFRVRGARGRQSTRAI